MNAFQAESQAEARPIRIVIIDDHSLVREGLMSLLQQESNIAVVGSCGSAKDGLDVISAEKPDVVLTDIGMPDSPFDMIRSAQAACPNVKFIFVTAYDTDINLERALQVGAHGFLSKLDPSETVCAAIRAVASGQEFFSEEFRDRLVEVRSRTSSLNQSQRLAAKHRLLSPREYEVLTCVAKGQSAKQIAKNLHISVKTVDRHKSNIMTKLGIHSQVELARYAIREGLIQP